MECELPGAKVCLRQDDVYLVVIGDSSSETDSDVVKVRASGDTHVFGGTISYTTTLVNLDSFQGEHWYSTEVGLIGMVPFGTHSQV